MNREEAIQIIREQFKIFNFNAPTTNLERALLFFAPELRESEDERIRKALVSLKVNERQTKTSTRPFN